MMTRVTAFFLLILAFAPAAAQSNATWIRMGQPRPQAGPPGAPNPISPPQADDPALPATSLYRRLRSVGLDPARVYHIRDAALDREGMHIAFNDGIIAFTEAVDGAITGAFFEGEGEVLVMPPNKVERHSLSLFTGAAILEQNFTTAYIRFNDATFSELEPWLRREEKEGDFITRWNGAARTLADSGALRLLLTFYNRRESGPNPHDRMLQARITGGAVGTFDLYFDTLAEEQISVGRMSYVEGTAFYDVWASFPMRSRRSRGGVHALIDPEHDIRRAMDVLKYQITTTVRPPTDIESEAVIDIHIRQPGHRVVYFELSRYLKLAAVEADGAPVEFIQNEALEGTELARRGNDVVTLAFAKPLLPGRRMKLRFVYSGSVLKDAGGGLTYVGARGTWYPNRGLVMCDFDLTFTHPADVTLVATGERVSQGAGADGALTSRWVSRRPIPLAGFNLGRYNRAQARAGEVSVETYAAGIENSFLRARPEQVVPMDTRRPGPVVVPPAPPNPAAQAQQVADAAARALAFYSQHFGPYPYGWLAMTQMPGGLSQSWPNLVYLSSYSFLTSAERKRARMDPYLDVLYGRVMAAHEVAHQWWGDLIVWKTYRDQWLVEALSNYSALMMLEEESPEEFAIMMERYRRDLLLKIGEAQVKDAGPVTLGTRLSTSKFPDAYEQISYGRGTWLLHMLRHMLRDAQQLGSGKRTFTPLQAGAEEPFTQVLRRIREQTEGKEFSTDDFQRAFEEALPESLRLDARRSLDWFFDSWVDGTAMPRIELAEVKFSKTGASVRGKILQKDAPDHLVTSVPIYRDTAQGPVLLGRVFADGPETAFRFTVPAGTRRLLLDPFRTVLTQP